MHLLTTILVTAATLSLPATAAAARPQSQSPSDTYIPIITRWRKRMNLPVLTHSARLERNAIDAAAHARQINPETGREELEHKLNRGSLAQVLAPGGADEFERVWVGGWLCERPVAFGMKGVCQITRLSKGWDHRGQTGHADILRERKYKSVGCGNRDGVWGCDFGK